MRASFFYLRALELIYEIQTRFLSMKWSQPVMHCCQWWRDEAALHKQLRRRAAGRMQRHAGKQAVACPEASRKLMGPPQQSRAGTRMQADSYVGRQNRPSSRAANQYEAEDGAVFSFLYLKKIKISKIYVRFGKFQKYTPVALWGATGLKCNFFEIFQNRHIFLKF